MSQLERDRWWAKVLETADGHWLWQGAVSSAGYGNFKLGSRNVEAHRFAWAERHGPLDPGDRLTKDGVDGCDDVLCVRPEHWNSEDELAMRGVG